MLGRIDPRGPGGRSPATEVDEDHTPIADAPVRRPRRRATPGPWRHRDHDRPARHRHDLRRPPMTTFDTSPHRRPTRRRRGCCPPRPPPPTRPGRTARRPAGSGPAGPGPPGWCCSWCSPGPGSAAYRLVDQRVAAASQLDLAPPSSPPPPVPVGSPDAAVVAAVDAGRRAADRARRHRARHHPADRQRRRRRNEVTADRARRPASSTVVNVAARQRRPGRGAGRDPVRPGRDGLPDPGAGRGRRRGCRSA